MKKINFHTRSRLGRSEYMYSLGVTISILLVVGLLAWFVSALGSTIGTVLLFAFGLGFLVTFVWIIGLSVMRLHDIGVTGWWILLCAILPFLGLLFFPAMMIVPGSSEENKWGSPREKLNTKAEYFFAILGPILLIVFFVLMLVMSTIVSPRPSLEEQQRQQEQLEILRQELAEIASTTEVLEGVQESR